MTEVKATPYFQLNSFCNSPFSGNPAGVCPLDKWIPDAKMQEIAKELNLSETAFVVQEGDNFNIRWFTPKDEVNLCGHATLATAYTLWNEQGYRPERITFNSKSGPLHVTRDGEKVILNFPTIAPRPVSLPPNTKDLLGCEAVDVFEGDDLFFVLKDEDQVRNLSPDVKALSNFPSRGVVVTAPGRNCDFVSRAFFPKLDVAEDPVTGSTHCTLTPYWASKLDKDTLVAKQLSQRGGELYCRLLGDRTEIAGQVVPFMKGAIYY